MEPPSPPTHEFRMFKAGLAELRKYNPDLKFWGGDVRDNDWQWPDPKVPRPKPPKPKRRVRTDMTNAEAEYWMCRLQCALRTIGSTNVKSLEIEDKDGHQLVYQGEIGNYVPMRVFDFHDEEYFNRKKAKTLRIHGYLPIKRERPSSADRWTYGSQDDEGTIKFRIFMRYIEEFMRGAFNLDAETRDVEITDSEWWKIPLSPCESEMSDGGAP